MALNLTAPPACEPVSLEEARAQCRITSTAEDGLLAGYILAARQHVESITNRTMVTSSWQYVIDEKWPIYYDRKRGFNRKLIQLPKSPIQSVQSIQYIDTNGDTQTLDPSQYVVYGLHDPAQPAGAIPGLGCIEPVFGIIWPLIRHQGNAITVDFTAGYGDGPSAMHEALRQAMLMLIAHWFDNRSPALEKARGLQVPYAVEALTAPHRIWFGDETHNETFYPYRLWN